MHQLRIKTIEMQFALNGKAPWGEVYMENVPPAEFVLLYREMPSSFCYVTIQSRYIHDQLVLSKKQKITVEFNKYYDFGHEGGFDVRSVDGVLVNDGIHPAAHVDVSSGLMENPSDQPRTSTEDCP
jgi:hypothetical protein